MQSLDTVISQLHSSDEDQSRAAVDALADYYWEYPNTKELRSAARKGWEHAREAWSKEGRLDELVMFVMGDMRVRQDPAIGQIADALQTAHIEHRPS